MPTSEALTARALDILETLVAFDTTSRLSNLALIEGVEAYLDGRGGPHRRSPRVGASGRALAAAPAAARMAADGSSRPCA